MTVFGGSMRPMRDWIREREEACRREGEITFKRESPGEFRFPDARSDNAYEHHRDVRFDPADQGGGRPMYVVRLTRAIHLLRVEGADAWLAGGRSPKPWVEFAPDLYGAFPVKRLFWVVLTVFCSERERPFFVPSPAIRLPERAEGVKGPKR